MHIERLLHKHGATSTEIVNKFGARQQRVGCHNHLSVHTPEHCREQSELLNEQNLVINHNQITDVKYMSREYEDKLRNEISTSVEKSVRAPTDSNKT